MYCILLFFFENKCCNAVRNTHVIKFKKNIKKELSRHLVFVILVASIAEVLMILNWLVSESY